jgi:NAD(P)-dependent dehydrogenase (short-subunit alcohol dehydrogenase family)
MGVEAQKPVGSGFGAKTSAAEAIAGVSLAGKRAIVTGGHSGIGIETVRALCGAGAEVTIPARNPDAARRAVEKIRGTKVASMDLADLASVAKFARDYAAEGKPLHLLINNAGVMASPETRVGKGWELQFATNHLGHFALTAALTPLLEKAAGARVVALSSSAHKRSDIRWDDIHFRATPYDKWVAYGQSKTANALFAVELDARLRSRGVGAFAVHPGGIMTPLQRHLQNEEMVALGWHDEKGEASEAAKLFFKTPEQGAATSVWCATSPRLDGLGGVYCEDCDIALPAGEKTGRYWGVMPHAVNAESAARLWRETEKMLA